MATVKTLIGNVKGPQGPQGANGKTPLKGTDYWTEQDKQEIVDEVKESIDLPSDIKAFSKVTTGGGTWASANSEDSLLTLSAGDNMRIDMDTKNDKFTFHADVLVKDIATSGAGRGDIRRITHHNEYGDYTFGVATLNANDQLYGNRVALVSDTEQGAMSKEDKAKLDGFGSASEYAKQSKVDELTEEIANDKNIYFKVVDGGIYVKTRYSNTHDIIYYLSKHGANSIFDFYSIGKIAKSTPISNVVTPTSYLVQTSGDWHAPYVVKAVNNADGQMLASDYFTGGNHGYDNTATGVPTGRTNNLEMYANGKLVVSGNDGYCDNIRIEWDNYVQAYNTTKANGSGREVLREHITMVFDGYKWDTETTIYPLENIIIKKWYGLQFFTLNYLYVAYIGGETGLIYEKSESSESGNATTNAMKFFNLEDTAIVEFDTLYDLGTRKKATSTSQGFFARASYNKAYGTVIDGSAELVSGGAYSLRGSYTFKHEVQQAPIYESNTVVSLLNLNRTASSNSNSYLAENCESVYINPAKYDAITVTGTACGVANLTENSITVAENGTGGTGCAFPLSITNYYGKTLLLTLDATGTTDTRFRLMCLGNSNIKYGDIDNKKGTVNSATITISSDGNTITINGTAVTSNGNPFTNVSFFFGCATGKTVSYTNVMLVESK